MYPILRYMHSNVTFLFFLITTVYRNTFQWHKSTFTHRFTSRQGWRSRSELVFVSVRLCAFLAYPVLSMMSVWEVKIYFSHTRYWVLGTELIPMYRQSAHRWHFKSSPCGGLPLLSARPAVTFPAKWRCRPLTGIKLYCLVTKAHTGSRKQVAQCCYAVLTPVRIESTT